MAETDAAPERPWERLGRVLFEYVRDGDGFDLVWDGSTLTWDEEPPEYRRRWTAAAAAVASAATAELRAEVEAARARAGCYLERAERAEARVAALERVLVLAAIPLEVLHATEKDGRALSDGVKQDIAAAVSAIRAALDGGRGAGGESYDGPVET